MQGRKEGKGDEWERARAGRWEEVRRAIGLARRMCGRVGCKMSPAAAVMASRVERRRR